MNGYEQRGILGVDVNQPQAIILGLSAQFGWADCGVRVTVFRTCTMSKHTIMHSSTLQMQSSCAGLPCLQYSSLHVKQS